MEKYDFDKIVDRSGSGDYKHGGLLDVFGREDLIPLWVADMDFETAPFITEALRKRLDHSLFGYTSTPKDFWPTVKQWIYDHHQWDVKTEWLTFVPGIVKAIGFVVNRFVAPDEKVIIQSPVYHPFRLVPQGNGREVVYNPLIENPRGSYSMDFANLEMLAEDPKCKLLILSNPHNPAGIVWPRETLVKVAEICHRNGVLVISDEIHCDMALFGHKHIPFASVSPEAAECSITFQAPSKTFNIAGIVSSYAIVPNDKLRKEFYGWLDANEFNEAPIFAPIATIAAYKYGEPWRKELISYIEGNVLFVEKYLSENIPAIKAVRPQASFLVWLDCRDLGLNHDELINLFIDKAHLALNDGEMFGKEGAGFMRLNIGSPRSVLKKALDQLRNALYPVSAKKGK
jgi:cystathionine beta-lyase